MAIIKYKDKDGNLVPLGASGDHTHSPESIGAAKKDHGHNVATEDSDGFMSSADKVAITDLNNTIFGNDEKNVVGLVDNVAGLAALVGEGVVSERIAAAVANKVEKDGSKVLSTNDYTDADKTKLKGIAEGAEVNQNAFSNVVIGDSTIAADDKTDSITLATGDNITLTPDIADGKVTISATDTTYSEVTNETPGLMSVDDKKKLDGIATGATKVMVDDSLSDTSSNAVQNNVVTKAIETLIATVGEGSVAERINAAKDDCITDLSVIGTTITYTKGDGTSETITTQDTNTTNFTITANAEDDDVVILSGTDGTNAVTYSASHAKKGPSTGYTSGNAITSISGFGGTGTIKVPQITVDQYGHVTNAADEDITITIPNKPTVDNTLSSTSTNAIQNKVVYNAINTLNAYVGDRAVSEQITEAITGHNHDGTYAPNKTMTGASSSANGASGLVPQPTKGNQSKFLCADGTWQTPYTHPTTAGNKHIPSGGASGQFLKWSADGTATWASAPTTTVDSSLSSTSTNPVQNNVIYTALSGKASSSHGNHVPTTQTADNAVFLRNDNTWQTVTPENIGAAAHKVMSSTDFNTMKQPGIYTMEACTTNVPNSSSSTYYSLIVTNSDDGTSGYIHQIAISEGTHDAYLRYCNSGTWSSWKRLALAEEVGGSSVGVFSTSADGLVPKPASNTSNWYLNAAGSWSAISTLISSANSGKSYLVGTVDMGYPANIYSNNNCYMENGHLYSNGSKVLTEGAIQAGSTSALFSASRTGDSWGATTVMFTKSYTSAPVVTISFYGDSVQHISDVQLDIYSDRFIILYHSSLTSAENLTVNWIAVGQ